MRHLDGIYTQKFNRLIIVTDRCFAAGIKRFSSMLKNIFFRCSAIFIKTLWAARLVIEIDRYRWSSHWGYLNQKQCPDWLDSAKSSNGWVGLKHIRDSCMRRSKKRLRNFTAALPKAGIGEPRIHRKGQTKARGQGPRRRRETRIEASYFA